MLTSCTADAQVNGKPLDLGVGGVVLAGLDSAHSVVVQAGAGGDGAKLANAPVQFGLHLQKHVNGFSHGATLRQICLECNDILTFVGQAPLPCPECDDSNMKKTTVNVLAANLAALRERHGMPKSQAEIAAKSGVDQTTIGRSLRATNALSVDKLDGIAKAFGVQPWHLIAPELAAHIEGLSPHALEVAMLYETPNPAKRAHLYATAQMLHNPDAEPEPPTEVERPAWPVAVPTKGRARGM